MKVEIDEVKKLSGTNVYQLGKTFYYEGELFLVVETLHGVGLLNLKLNLIVCEEETLEQLIDSVSSARDRFVDVKIVEV